MLNSTGSGQITNYLIKLSLQQPKFMSYIVSLPPLRSTPLQEKSRLSWDPIRLPILHRQDTSCSLWTFLGSLWLCLSFITLFPLTSLRWSLQFTSSFLRSLGKLTDSARVDRQHPSCQSVLWNIVELFLEILSSSHAAEVGEMTRHYAYPNGSNAYPRGGGTFSISPHRWVT